MVSPVENKRTGTAKRPRKGKPTYPEMCGRTVENDKTDRERSDDSEGSTTVGRRNKERRGPQGLPSSDKGERVDDIGALKTRRRKVTILIKVEEG
jgi:hypothetical protein